MDVKAIHLPPKPIPRPPSPTPTLSEALSNLPLARQRFRHLCANGSQVEIAELLDAWCGSPQELNYSQPPHPSPLCEAAQNGRASLLQYLSDRGFDLLDSESFETVPQTAAMGAAMTGDTSVLEMLVGKGWEVNNLYGMGGAALALALENADVVAWFLAHGADPNAPARPSLDLTVTTRAASMAPLPVIQQLLSHSGNVTGTDAVAQAVIGHVNGVLGRLEVVEYLLDHGAPIDIFAYNDITKTAHVMRPYGRENGLLLATREGKEDMVGLLVKRGADRGVRGRWGNTGGENALEIAERKGFEGVAKLLRGKHLHL